MLHAVVAASFKNIGEPDHITVDVRQWILDGITHPRLSGKIDNALELLLFEQGGDALAVREVHLNEAKIRVLLKLRQSRFFQRDFVVIIEIVQSDNLITSCQQDLGSMKANKSGSAGQEDFHLFSRLNRRLGCEAQPTKLQPAIHQVLIENVLDIKQHVLRFGQGTHRANTHILEFLMTHRHNNTVVAILL